MNSRLSVSSDWDLFAVL